MATHSSILAWEIQWTEEPGRLPVHGVTDLDMTDHTHTHTQASRQVEQSIRAGVL